MNLRFLVAPPVLVGLGHFGNGHDVGRDAIDASASIKAPVVELHTGAWCYAHDTGDNARAAREFERLVAAAAYAAERGLEVHAGHGLNFETARQISALAQIAELNIGHFLIGEAIFAGLDKTIQNMRKAMDKGRAKVSAS